jgi:hypothetical protein
MDPSADMPYLMTQHLSVPRPRRVGIYHAIDVNCTVACPLLTKSTNGSGYTTFAATRCDNHRKVSINGGHGCFIAFNELI